MKEKILDSLKGLLAFAFKKANELELLKGNSMNVNTELMRYSEEVCIKTHDGIIRAIGDNISNFDNIKFVETVGCSCFLIGMGATKKWHDDRDGLLSKGIFEYLTEHSGVAGLEREMVSIIGYDPNTIEFKEFIHKANMLFELTLNQAYYAMKKFFTEDSSFNSSVMGIASIEVHKVMFNLGIAIEMQNLNK